MKLEGSLDAFGLADVFALLSATAKSGGLHVHKNNVSVPIGGVVWFRQGRICGATSDLSRSSLARRVVGSGAVDDTALRQAVARSVGGTVGVARALLESGSVDPDYMRATATEHIGDAVFELMQWSDGEFGFDESSADLDDVGVSVEVAQVLALAQSRAQAWSTLAGQVSDLDAVFMVEAVATSEVRLRPDQWSIMALINGHRSVADLIELTGSGRFAVTAALVELVERGLVRTRDASSPDHVAIVERRLAMLASIEATPSGGSGGGALPSVSGVFTPIAPGGLGLTAAAALAAARAARDAREQEERVSQSHALRIAPAQLDEPWPGGAAPTQQPGYEFETASPYGGNLSPPGAQQAAAGAPLIMRPSAFAARTSQAAITATHGATARSIAEPGLDHMPGLPMSDRDPALNRSLLLRLIAGVRGL